MTLIYFFTKNSLKTENLHTILNLQCIQFYKMLITFFNQNVNASREYFNRFDCSGAFDINYNQDKIKNIIRRKDLNMKKKQ